MTYRSRTREEHRSRAEQMLKGAGAPMSKHADVKQDKALIKSELSKHVEPGALKKLASGGRAKGPKNITINVGNEQQAEQRGMQKGVQVGAQMGARAAAAKMAGPPPGVGGPPGSPPPGAMPPHPPMGGPGGPPMGPPPGAGGPPGGMKKGGVVKVAAHVRRKPGPFERTHKEPFDK